VIEKEWWHDASEIMVNLKEGVVALPRVE